MNAREQLLKKRVESLEGQLEASLELLGRVLGENEYMASVACAFAWDLVDKLDPYRYAFTQAQDAAENARESVIEDWASAVEEASK